MNQAASDGGGGGADAGALELSGEAATTIIAAHERAARRITELAGSVPDIDAGEGGEALHAILTAVLRAGDTLARVNTVTAAQVQAARDDYAATDATVAGTFTISPIEMLAGGGSSSPFPFGFSGLPGPSSLPGSPAPVTDGRSQTP
ncbi:hypothetical protein [Nocardioides sp.]|uniref:hypothetical protein n=1 Tax=Nocardioides sp. TaxID=35761 RepID=UPI003517FD8A